MRGKIIKIDIFKDSFARLLLGASLLLNLATFLVALYAQKYLPPVVPLFYSRPWGKDQLASPVYLVLLPVLSVLALAVNALIANLVSEKLLQRSLLAASLVVSLLSSIAVLKVILLIL